MSATFPHVRNSLGASITSMAPYQDKGGNTGLWLAGNGLWHIAKSDIIGASPADNPKREIQRISADQIFAGSTNLTVAQAKNDLAIWFSNNDHTLGYVRASNNGSLAGEPTPLLPNGSAIDYTALLDRVTGSQSLVVVGEHNKLIVMEQSRETDLWNQRDVVVHKPNGLVELNAFVSHIELRNVENDQPLPNTKLFLECEGWASLLINGEEKMIGAGPQHGAVVQTDAKGIITIVQPTDDVSGYKYTFSNLHEDDVTEAAMEPVIAPEGFVVDPTQKAQDALFNIDSVEKLRKLGASGTDEELQEAAEAMKKLRGINKDVAKSPPANQQRFMMTSAFAAPASAAAAPAMAFAPNAASLGSTIKEKLWGAWEWVKRQWNKVKKWVIEAVDGVWKFIVHIAGEVWHFILDTAAKIAKAAVWLLEKVKAGIKAVIDFVKFLFNWSDIKETAHQIEAMVNSFLDFGIYAVDKYQPKVDTWINDMEKKLGEALGLKLPDALANKKLTPKEAANAEEKTKDTTSPEANTGNYHLEQGLKTAPQKNTTPLDVIGDLYKNVLLPIFEDAKNNAEALSKRFVELFQKEGSLSVSNVMEFFVGEIIHLLIQTIKSIVMGVMNLGRTLLQGVKDVLNSEIDFFGIFGGLFKKLGIKLPSWLTVLSFVVAIPVTIFAKIITGEKPKRIAAFDAKSMVEGGIDKPTALAYNELAGYVEMTYAFVSVVIKIFKVGSAEIPIEMEAFSILSLAGDLIMLACTYPYDQESPGWEYRSVSLVSPLSLRSDFRFV